MNRLRHRRQPAPEREDCRIAPFFPDMPCAGEMTTYASQAGVVPACALHAGYCTGNPSVASGLGLT